MAHLNAQQKLVDWFITHGGFVHSSIELEKNVESGQYFRCAQDVEIPSSGQVELCLCPFSLTLSHLNILNSLPPALRSCSDESVCTKLLGIIPTAAVSYFFLAEQRLKGAESFWEAYINTLPKEEDMNTPLWFERDDLKWLLGTTIHTSGTDPTKSGLMMRKAMWKNQWRQGIELLQNTGCDVDRFTWELYLWAATVFTSRSFTSTIMMSSNTDSFALLYPVIDSFNHRFGAKVIWNMEQGNFGFTLTESIKKDEQVYNNYAPKGNEELLMGYGFCIQDNPCDEVTIRLGRPPESVHAALKNQFPARFTSTDWDPEEATFFLRGSHHYSGGYRNEIPCLRGLSNDMFGTIRAIISSAFQAQLEDGDEISDDELDYASIQAILDRLLDKRQAIVQWDSHVPPRPQNIRQTHAKTYRDGQLRILDEIISELQEHLENV